MCRAWCGVWDLHLLWTSLLLGNTKHCITKTVPGPSPQAP